MTDPTWGPNGAPCPKCDGTEFAGVEYRWPHPESYDGVSEWLCSQCGARYGRWSGKELAEGEAEKQFGGL